MHVGISGESKIISQKRLDLCFALLPVCSAHQKLLSGYKLLNCILVISFGKHEKYSYKLCNMYSKLQYNWQFWHTFALLFDITYITLPLFYSAPYDTYMYICTMYIYIWCYCAIQIYKQTYIYKCTVVHLPPWTMDMVLKWKRDLIYI